MARTGPSVLSLCSGIGGLELGVRRVWPGAHVVGYVEREAYAAAVLLARMEAEDLEPAPVWCGNLEDIDAGLFEGVDLVTAGFPCQPFSSAATRGRRAVDLWPEVRRLISQIGPRWVLLENVSDSAVGGACSDLEVLGYRAARDRFCSSELGCPSRRVRWFAVAHSDSNGQLGEPVDAEMALVQKDRVVGWWDNYPGRLLGVADGVPHRVDRLRCLGNAVVPQQAELAIRTLYGRMT